METGKNRDGKSMNEAYRDAQFVISPHIAPVISPTFTNSVTTNTTAAASASVTLTQEIRDCILGLRRDMNELAEEAGEDLRQDCEKLSGALEKLEQCETQEELRSSGAINKFIRFLENCKNPESRIGKVLSGVEDAADIVRDMIGKYNKIAAWAPGLPVLPFGDSE